MTTTESPLATLTRLLGHLFSDDSDFDVHDDDATYSYSRLPPSLVSKTTLQAHHYLSLSPSDDRYWTCGIKQSQVTLARREIVQARSLESIELGTPLYSCDLEGELKALVPVSLAPAPGSSSCPILDVILVFENRGGEGEGEEESVDEGGWKFLRLSAPSIVLEAPDNGFNALVKGGNSRPTAPATAARNGLDRNEWFASIDAAVQALAASSSSSSSTKPSPAVGNVAPRHERLESRALDAQGEGDEDEFDECGTRRRKPGQGGFKTREEMAEGEGTTPGAYGDSNDFWAGWSDSENEDDHQGDDDRGHDRARGGGGRGGDGGDNERDSGVGYVVVNNLSTATERRDEDDYWNGYGKVAQQVDDGRQDPTTVVDDGIKPPAPRGERASLQSETTTEAKSVPNRSRRSSTVTRASFAPIVAEASSSSFLSFDSTVQAASSRETLQSEASQRRDADAGSLGSAVKLASVTRTTNPQGEELPSHEEGLRFALAGIWSLYNRGGEESRAERERKFRTIVEQVLRS